MCYPYTQEKRMEPQSIGMISAGTWGTAVSKVLAENGHQVQMWSYEQAVAHAINNTLVDPDKTEL